MSRATPDWDSLQAAIAGDVILPGSPSYERVRKPFIARFDEPRPRAVVLCQEPDDAAETISLARRYGLNTATRCGGHSFAGYSSTGGVVIDVTPMSSCLFSNGVATVGAGMRTGDMYERLLDHDITVPAGTCFSVGIAGVTLGGGLGMLGRRYGLTSDHLLGAQVVLTGIRPEVAQTLVGLGVDFSRITTRATLQNGLEYALRFLNYDVKRK